MGTSVPSNRHLEGGWGGFALVASLVDPSTASSSGHLAPSPVSRQSLGILLLVSLQVFAAGRQSAELVGDLRGGLEEGLDHLDVALVQRLGRVHVVLNSGDDGASGERCLQKGKHRDREGPPARLGWRTRHRQHVCASFTHNRRFGG